MPKFAVKIERMRIESTELVIEAHYPDAARNKALGMLDAGFAESLSADGWIDEGTSYEVKVYIPKGEL